MTPKYAYFVEDVKIRMYMQKYASGRKIRVYMQKKIRLLLKCVYFWENMKTKYTCLQIRSWPMHITHKRINTSNLPAAALHYPSEILDQRRL